MLTRVPTRSLWSRRYVCRSCLHQSQQRAQSAASGTEPEVVRQPAEGQPGELASTQQSEKPARQHRRALPSGGRAGVAVKGINSKQKQASKKKYNAPKGKEAARTTTHTGLAQSLKAALTSHRKSQNRTDKVVKKRAVEAPAQSQVPTRSTESNPMLKSASSDHNDIATTSPNEMDLRALDIPQQPVPALQYGLDRVLFNPGVYQLQDLRTRIYNFDPYLQKIMPVSEFDFNALKQFVTSSQDPALANIANTYKKKYVGSTSSMTGALSHFHYLLSAWRLINIDMLSKAFPEQANTFTQIQRAPVSLFLRWQSQTGTYAIDADKEYDRPNVLAMLGKSLEKLLTIPKGEYEAYRRSTSGDSAKTADLEPESYHYSTLGDILMRSQLDAYDPRLPGTGMFDLKTRAVISIRMNVSDYETGSGYEIRAGQGRYESFEREYYDMLRATALKYSLQARMGRMDGIFVAYHNVARIFGFQYISLEELDRALHGQADRILGDQEFKLSLIILNRILDKATQRFPNQTLRLHFETRGKAIPFMYIFAEPVTDSVVDKIQTKNKVEVENFEREIFGLKRPTTDAYSGLEQGWEEIKAMVEEEMTVDMLGDDSTEVDTDLYSKLSKFAGQISRKRQELTEGSTEISDLDGEESEFNELAQEAAELEAGLSRLRNIADQFTAKTQTFKEKLEQHETNNPGLKLIIEQLDDILDDVREESERFNLHLRDEPGTDIANKHQPAAQIEKTSNGNHDPGMAAPKAENEVENIINRDPMEARLMDFSDAAETVKENANDPSDSVTIQAEHMGSVSGSEEQHNPMEEHEEAAISTLTELASPGPLLAMTLTVRNKINEQYQIRPSSLETTDKWTIEYSLKEIEAPQKAWQLYEATKRRRWKIMDSAGAKEDAEHEDYFRRLLRDLSENGRVWRAEQDELDKKVPKATFKPLHGGD